MINKKELKIISADFRTKASRVLKSKYDDFKNPMRFFIDFIEGQPIIIDFIKSITDDVDNPEEDVKLVSEGRALFGTSNPTELKEVKYNYLLMKGLLSFNINNKMWITTYTRIGNTTKYQDGFEIFLEKQIHPFITHIESYLRNLTIQMGSDEDAKFIISAGQVIIAAGNATAIGDNNIIEKSEIGITKNK